MHNVHEQQNTEGRIFLKSKNTKIQLSKMKLLLYRYIMRNLKCSVYVQLGNEQMRRWEVV